MIGVAARSGSLRMPLQISRPSESGSMMSSRIRSGRTCRHSSSAPFPVCSPRQREAFLFQVVLQQGEEVGVVFDQQDLFHGAHAPTIPAAHVTERLRRGEFGIKLLLPECGSSTGRVKKNVEPSSTRLSTRVDAVVRRHQVLHDRKAQPGAAQFAGARLVHAVEALEQPRQVLLAESRCRYRARRTPHIRPRPVRPR